MNEFYISLFARKCIREEHYTVYHHGMLYYIEGVNIKTRMVTLNINPNNHTSGTTIVVPVSQVYQDPLRLPLNNYILDCLRKSGYDDVVKLLEDIDTI